LAFTNHHLQDPSGLIPLGNVEFTYTSSEPALEIVIEITSYYNGFSGLTKAPNLTGVQAYTRGLLFNSALKAMIIGILLFIALYQFIVVGFRSKEIGAIFLALMIMAGSLQVAFYHNRYGFLFASLFYVPEQITIYIHQLSMHITTLFFFLILFVLYYPQKRKFNHWESILFLFPIIMCVAIVFTPIQIFTSYINIFKLANLFNLFLIICYTLTHHKRVEYNSYMIFLSAGLFISYIYDLLTDINIVMYSEAISSGFFIIITLIYSSISAFLHERNMSSVEEIIQLNKKIRDTEFTFLNSQIQSHFIYNSLNSIQALINTNPAKAAELVDDFSTYLRTRLEFNKMPNLLNIEDELENIRTYLNIEKARFGKRVNYVYDLKVGDFMIPPLSVQPLVENAVKHGISMKKNGGTVTVSTYEDDHYIYIKVSDDGIGFDPTTLEEKQRVGTENIRNRLNLHLNATLSINSQINVGTESIIKIPKKVSIHKKSSSIM